MSLFSFNAFLQQCILYTYTAHTQMYIHKQYKFKKTFINFTDAPPILLYSFIEQTLQPGPAVSLKCSAAGNPTPQVLWSLDGFPLPTNGR